METTYTLQDAEEDPQVHQARLDSLTAELELIAVAEKRGTGEEPELELARVAWKFLQARDRHLTLRTTVYERHTKTGSHFYQEKDRG
jgi:hypothetical protein